MCFKGSLAGDCDGVAITISSTCFDKWLPGSHSAWKQLRGWWLSCRFLGDLAPSSTLESPAVKKRSTLTNFMLWAVTNRQKLDFVPWSNWFGRFYGFSVPSTWLPIKLNRKTWQEWSVMNEVGIKKPEKSNIFFVEILWRKEIRICGLKAAPSEQEASHVTKRAAVRHRGARWQKHLIDRFAVVNVNVFKFKRS